MQNQSRHPFLRVIRYLGIILAIAATSYLGATLGKALALPPSNITPLWPPSGIGLAALLLLGYRYFPGIWLGTFLFNYLFYAPEHGGFDLAIALSCAVHAAASTLQAVCGNYFSKRFAGFNRKEWNLDSFLKALVIGGPFCCLIASTIGTTTLFLTGAIPWNSSFLNTWVIWWFGDTTGVLLFTGLIVSGVNMIRNHHRKTQDWQVLWHFMSIAAILLTMASSLWAWHTLQAHTEQENKTHFNKLVHDAETSVKTRLLSYQDALHGGAGLFYASQNVSKEEWKSYIESLQIKKRYPGILGMGYIAYVPTAEMSQYIVFAKKAIQPNFTLKTFGETKHSDSFIVQFFEPLTPESNVVIGLDIGTEPARRKAAEISRDSSRDQVTSIIRLMNTNDKDPAFLLLVPVYQNNTEARTLENNRKHIKGWVYAPFVGKYLFEDILPKDHSEIAFSVYDDVPNPKLIYSNFPSANSSYQHSVYHKFEFAGHRWKITWQTTPDFKISPSSSQPIFVLIFGLVLTLLVGALLVLLNTTRNRAISYAQKMTAALADMNHTLQDRNKVLEHAVEGIAQLDQQGFYVSINKAFSELTGYLPEEIKGLSWRETIIQEEIENVIEAYRDMRISGKHTIETIGIKKDGSTFFTEIVLVPNLGPDNEFLGHFSFIKDISDKKQHEQELKASEERFRSSIEQSPIGMALVGLDGKWLQVNHALSQIIGYTKEELMELDFQTITHPDDLEADLAYVNQMLLGSIDTYQMEKRYIHKQGYTVWIQLNVSFVLDDNKKPLYFISQIQDITQRRKMESHLMEAMVLAEQSSRSKSEFLANMSHEIRTPMNGILGLTEILLGSEVSHEQRQQLDMVRTSGQALMTIINDILDFSKIESGKFDLDPIRFKLRECIRDIVYPFSQQAHDKNIELIWRVTPDVPNELIGDPGRLRQILNNLLGNALKFTHDGEVMLLVSLNKTNSQTAELEFCVSDTGIGLAPDKQQMVFEPFSQADGSTSRKYGGTGLGLSICSSLVGMMKGRIWLESQLGKGSKFFFTSSFEICSDAPQVIIPADIDTFANMPVLVVEDNATSRLVFNEFLKDWQMSPTLVRTGETAIEFLQHAVNLEHPYALVLLDVGLPGMDGFDIARAIKDDDRLKNTKIILLTSHAQPGDGAKCRDIGVDAYLPKPIMQDELLQAIQSVFGMTVSQSLEPSLQEQLITRHSMAENDSAVSILLAEDNDINQAIALHLLKAAGYQVTVANNGKEAVSHYLSNRFDVILMDIHMPEMDGYTATKQIREYEKSTLQRVPIIALTANAMKGDKEKCLAADMDDYISKPFKREELLGMITKTSFKT